MSGLSYVQVDKHDITILYHLHISVDLVHHEIFPAEVGKGGIKAHNQTYFLFFKHTLWVLKTNLNETASLSTLNTF